MEFAAILSACVAVVAVLVAINARSDSKISADSSVKSADAATSSAGEAKRSADAAEESVDLARRERARATERTDVDFTLELEDGVLVFRNAGTTTAHAVEVAVDVAGTRILEERGDILGGESFSIDVSEHEREHKERETERMRAAPEYVILSPGEFTYSARLTWLTFYGTPGVQAFDEPDS